LCEREKVSMLSHLHLYNDFSSKFLFIGSAKILTQPIDIIIPEGPPVSQTYECKLVCQADGWPVPKFQWRRNGKIVPGADGPELKLRLVCVADNDYRSFRCTVCKNFSKLVPKNAFRITCSNCRNPFDFKEVCFSLIFCSVSVDFAFLDK
jgi:hypothetical protein